MQRRGRGIVVLGLMAAGLTACGGSGGTSTAPSPAPTAAAPTAAGTPLQPTVAPTTLPPPKATASPVSTGAAPAGNGCATSQLTVTHTQGQGAAGTEFSGITFTNRSSSTCTLRGYPGVSLLDGQRRQIGESAKRESGDDPVIALAPGQQATASFSVSPAACGDDLPPNSAYLRIFPPGQRADIVLSAKLIPCGPRIRPVHAGGHISPG